MLQHSMGSGGLACEYRQQRTHRTGSGPTCQVACEDHNIWQHACTDEAVVHKEVHNMKHSSCMDPGNSHMVPIRPYTCSLLTLFAAVPVQRPGHSTIDTRNDMDTFKT